MPSASSSPHLHSRPGPRSRYLLASRFAALASASLALVVGALVGVAGAGPAHAHDQIVGSTPSTDAVLDVAPAEITLQYSANIMEIGPMIVLQDAAGRTWQTAEPVIDGTTVTSAVADELPVGSYSIAWRVVSSDGHPITGTVPFTIDGPASDSADPSPSETALSTPITTPDADLGETAVEGQNEQAVETTKQSEARQPLDVSRLLLVGGLGAVVALGVAWVVIRARKGSRAQTASDASRDAAPESDKGTTDAR